MIAVIFFCILNSHYQWIFVSIIKNSKNSPLLGLCYPGALWQCVLSL